MKKKLSHYLLLLFFISTTSYQKANAVGTELTAAGILALLVNKFYEKSSVECWTSVGVCCWGFWAPKCCVKKEPGESVMRDYLSSELTDEQKKILVLLGRTFHKTVESKAKEEKKAGGIKSTETKPNPDDSNAPKGFWYNFPDHRIQIVNMDDIDASDVLLDLEGSASTVNDHGKGMLKKALDFIPISPAKANLASYLSSSRKSASWKPRVECLIEEHLVEIKKIENKLLIFMGKTVPTPDPKNPSSFISTFKPLVLVVDENVGGVNNGLFQQIANQLGGEEADSLLVPQTVAQPPQTANTMMSAQPEHAIPASLTGGHQGATMTRTTDTAPQALVHTSSIVGKMSDISFGLAEQLKATGLTGANLVHAFLELKRQARKGSGTDALASPTPAGLHSRGSASSDQSVLQTTATLPTHRQEPGFGAMHPPIGQPTAAQPPVSSIGMQGRFLGDTDPVVHQPQYPQSGAGAQRMDEQVAQHNQIGTWQPHSDDKHMVC